MAPRIGRYVKTPDERKRYRIDYSDWLDTGEYVLTWVPQIDDNDPVTPLVVDDIQVTGDGMSVIFMVSGGADLGSYLVQCLMTTSGTQIKEDYISFSVREIDGDQC